MPVVVGLRTKVSLSVDGSNSFARTIRPIYVPVEVARDSAFPFKSNEFVTVKVDKGKSRLIVEKTRGL